MLVVCFLFFCSGLNIVSPHLTVDFFGGFWWSNTSQRNETPRQGRIISSWTLPKTCRNPWAWKRSGVGPRPGDSWYVFDMVSLGTMVVNGGKSPTNMVMSGVQRCWQWDMFVYNITGLIGKSSNSMEVSNQTRLAGKSPARTKWAWHWWENCRRRMFHCYVWLLGG